jgi:hypothetical protein
VDGIWYEVKMKEYYGTTANGVMSFLSVSTEDKVLGRHYHSLEQMRKVYGGNYIAVSKRPLKKKEIRFANLEK